jgi:hypothetical protein
MHLSSGIYPEERRAKISPIKVCARIFSLCLNLSVESKLRVLPILINIILPWLIPYLILVPRSSSSINCCSFKEISK